MTDVDRTARHLAILEGRDPDAPTTQVVTGNGHGPALNCWRADDLMRTEFPPTRWAVDGVLAEGVNLLAGAPKFGKSWMALGLAVAVASGGYAFGRVHVEAGDVLYLALEDTGRRLQDRLGKLLGDTPAPHRLTLATSWAGTEVVDTWLTNNPGARLVVVDVLNKVRPPQLRGESSYRDDYRALEPFGELSRRHRVCVLVLHHTRKALGEDFVDEVSGTHGLAGSADAVLVARRSRNTGAAILKVTGRDVEEHEIPLEFDPLTGNWTRLDGPAVLHDVAETRRAILEALDDARQQMTPTQVAEVTGIGVELVKKTLQRMAKDSQVAPAGSGTYVPLSLVSPESPAGDIGDARDTPSRGTHGS